MTAFLGMTMIPLTMLPSQRMEFSTSEARIFEPGRNLAWVNMGRSWS